MALYSGWAYDMPFKADVDMNSYQYKFVTVASTKDYVKLATGASNPVALGVIQNDPRPGELATVRVFGVTKLAASAPISYGCYVQCGSANGRAEYTTASTVNGIALESLATGSAYISVLLLGPMFAGAALPAS